MAIWENPWMFPLIITKFQNNIEQRQPEASKWLKRIHVEMNFSFFYLSLRASLVGGALHLFWGTMRPQDSAANILIS